MVTEKELQEKMLIYRTLESRLEALTRQRDMVSNKIVEIMSTVSSIDEVEKNQEGILFKLGGEAFARGNISDKNKILVEIGSGIVVERSIEDGKATLNGRRQELENTLKEVQNDVYQISTAMSQLGPEINELIQKSQQKASG